MKGNIIPQTSYEKYELEKDETLGTYNLTEDVYWENINSEDITIKGRIIGGCIDAIKNILGTKYDYTKEFIEKYKEDGIIWYFDIFSLTAEDFYLLLIQMKEAGWLDNLKGVIVGRVKYPNSFVEMTYQEALKKVLDVPVIFNALNEDIKIDSGECFLDNKKLETTDIGYVVSTPQVPEFLTGREFLQFYLDINKDKIEDIKDIDYYFDLVKLNKEDQNLLLKDYSHGMKNKIQMLINIISNSKIILLDEPLTSLDIVVQEEMKKLFKSYKENHIIIFSTHILELAVDLCDEIVILNNKQIELIEKKDLNTKKYKDKIIESLKAENND